MIVDKNFMELISHGITLQDKSVIPIALHADEREGRLRLRIMADGEAPWEEEVGGPCDPTGRFFSFCLDGTAMTCELPDGILHVTPDVGDQVQDINPWIQVLDGKVLRIQRAYAEQNLSPACLDLASKAGEAWYDWYITDEAHTMPLFELPALFGVEFQNISNHLSHSCPAYIARMGLTADNLMDVFVQNYHRHIWRPAADA